ncbi:MAG: PHP domain-containing protein [Thermoanaerobaculia bacterium]
MKVDLHCHTTFSPSPTFKGYSAYDAATKPETAYSILKSRGMDLVTFTDHDTIDGCLYLLNKYPDLEDFFVSEEVTSYIREAEAKVHIGAFYIDEKKHREIQKLRKNCLELVNYFKKEGIPYVLFHPASFPVKRKNLKKFWEFSLQNFPYWEIWNGSLPKSHSLLVLSILKDLKKKPFLVSGSDAHNPFRLASSYTFLERPFKPVGFYGKGISLPSQIFDVYFSIFSYIKYSFSMELISRNPKIFPFLLFFGIPMTFAGLPLFLILCNRVYLKKIYFQSRGVLNGYQS